MYCLYFIYARKSHVRSRGKITRQWKSTLTFRAAYEPQKTHQKTRQLRWLYASGKLGKAGYAIRAVKTRPPPHKTGFIQKIATIFQGLYKNLIPFSRKPTRSVSDRFVLKCTFPLHGNRTLRLELFAPPVSLHFPWAMIYILSWANKKH